MVDTDHGRPRPHTHGDQSLVSRVIGRVVTPVVDAVEPDDLLDRIDIDELLSRIDVDELLGRIDVDALLGRIDVNALLHRIDVDALMARVDVGEVVGRVDVNEVVGRVDVAALMDRVDVDALVERVDVPALVQRAGIEDIVRRSAGGLAGNALDLVRRQLVGVDVVADRVTDRVLGGGRAQGADEVTSRAVAGRLAGPVSRLAAAAFDLAAITFTFGLGVSMLQFLLRLFLDSDVDLTSARGWWWTVAFVLWGGCYLLVGPVLTGRTPGKALAGLRILHSGSDAAERRAITPRDALLRVLVYPMGFVFGLGFVGILIGRRHRGLHDLAAGTVVVYDWGERTATMPAPLERWLERQGVVAVAGKGAGPGL